MNNEQHAQLVRNRMSGTERPSPRQEALNAVLRTRVEVQNPRISEAAWKRLVALAWENRSQSGSRRDLRREMRAVLMDDSRTMGDD